jgi:hypothetical protein
MSNISESHFGPDSVRKINVTYHNAKRTKLKGSIKGKLFFCVLMSMNSLNQRIHLFSVTSQEANFKLAIFYFYCIVRTTLLAKIKSIV